MQIACNGCDDNFSESSCCAACKMRFQNLNAHLHSLCSYQHLRNENLVVFEFLADNTHGVDHALLKNLIGITSCVQSFLNRCANLFCASFFYKFSNFINFRHLFYPP